MNTQPPTRIHRMFPRSAGLLGGCLLLATAGCTGEVLDDGVPVGEASSAIPGPPPRSGDFPEKG